MDALRTPDHRFRDLPGYPWPPSYTSVEGLRVHHVEAGPEDGPVVLLMHGEPSWSYLYRTVIARLAREGFRVLAPDLPGFGRSDKPVRPEHYSYRCLVRWMTGWLEAVSARGVTLVAQDWGALVGLRLVADQPGRFARVVVANGALPTGRGRTPLVFRAWRAFARWSPRFPVSRVVRWGTRRPVSAAVAAAYEAPFPGEAYKAGARALPLLVPTGPDDPGAAENRAAWSILEEWTKPFLTAFSDGDPITRGLDRPFRRRIPGAQDREHPVIRGAGHFLQEDAGGELADVVAEFVRTTP